VKKVKVCTHYELDGKKQLTPPANYGDMARCKPIYKEFPGWMSPTSQIKRYEDLPVKAKEYVKALCDITGVPLGVLSVSPQRESTFRIAI
jgi:adenylosuccinate synthase